SAESAKDLYLGTCKVTIPRSHVMGSVDRPEPVLGILVNVLDPDRHVMLRDVEIIAGEEEFIDQVKNRVLKSDKKAAFVFVHGYNMTFEAAAMRTSQMAWDLQFEGAPMFFSWPSQGTEAGYPWDSDAVDESVDYLERFLSLLARKSEAKRIYLLAHSMG